MKTQKIIISAVIAFLGIVMSLDSQAQKAKVWSTGPEAGVSISRFGMDAGSNDSKAGAVLGGFVTYSIINTFAITTKFLYYQKGASFPSTNTKQTLNYFEVPVIGRFFLNKQGNFRPNVFAGPSFSFLTGASTKIGNGESTKTDSYRNTYNGVDVGITGGIGFNFRIYNETYFILDARYTHGITDVTKASGNVNNKSLGLTAGVSFGF